YRGTPLVPGSLVHRLRLPVMRQRLVPVTAEVRRHTEVIPDPGLAREITTPLEQCKCASYPFLVATAPGPHVDHVHQQQHAADDVVRADTLRSRDSPPAQHRRVAVMSGR